MYKKNYTITVKRKHRHIDNRTYENIVESTDWVGRVKKAHSNAIQCHGNDVGTETQTLIMPFKRARKQCEKATTLASAWTLLRIHCVCMLTLYYCTNEISLSLTLDDGKDWTIGIPQAGFCCSGFCYIRWSEKDSALYCLNWWENICALSNANSTVHYQHENNILLKR